MRILALCVLIRFYAESVQKWAPDYVPNRHKKCHFNFMPVFSRDTTRHKIGSTTVLERCKQFDAHLACIDPICDIYKKSWDPCSDNFGQHGPCAYGNTRGTGECTKISKSVGSISVPSYGNGRQNSGTNIAEQLGSIGPLLCYCRQNGEKFGQHALRKIWAA